MEPKHPDKVEYLRDREPHRIQCPQRALCTERTVTCGVFRATRRQVVAEGFCPEVAGKKHAAETIERFEQADEQEQR